MITRDRIIEVLKEIVAEKGEHFIYVNRDGDRANGMIACNYVHYDEDEDPIPGCIAGQAFIKLGGSFDELSEYEGKTAMTLPYPDILEYGAKSVLREAQIQQDKGNTYGYALKQAKNVGKSFADE